MIPLIITLVFEIVYLEYGNEAAIVVYYILFCQYLWSGLFAHSIDLSSIVWCKHVHTQKNATFSAYFAPKICTNTQGPR